MSQNYYSFLENLVMSLPVFLVYLLISSITYSYIVFYIFDKNSEFSLAKGVLFLIGLIILFFVLLCHILCVFVNPGNPERSEVVLTSPIHKSNEIQLKTESFEQNSETFCKKCDIIRPIRSHHCKTCQNCILKMDHHCPWINNCVGYYNHKYFYLFLFYTILGSILALCGLITKFNEIEGKFDYYFAAYIYAFNCIYSLVYSENTENTNLSIDSNNSINIENTTFTNYTSTGNNSVKEIIFENPFFDPFIIVLTTAICVITIVGVSVLFSLQTYLISQNVTGIEYHIHRPIESSPYYKPHNILRNFQKVMGNNVALWFIPVFYESKEEEDYRNIGLQNDNELKDFDLKIIQ